MRLIDPDYDHGYDYERYDEEVGFHDRHSLRDKVDEKTHLPVNERPMIKSDDVSERFPPIDKKLKKVSFDHLKVSLSMIKRIQRIATCDGIISVNEIYLCNGNLKHLGANCEIKDKTCRFKLACNTSSGKLICKKGEHVYTDVLCCNYKCKKIS